jgi:hypothetical protein
VGDGVLKSSDGGTTWSPLLGQSTLAGQNIRTILPTPVTTPSGQVVLAGTFNFEESLTIPTPLGGVYRSIDGGLDWTRISGTTTSKLPDGGVQSLVEDPTNPNIIYAGVVHEGVYQSLDAGLTWQPINGNLPNLLQQLSSPYDLSGATNLKLAISSSSGTTTLFLLTAGPSSSDYRAPGTSYLFYSANGGTSWSAMDAVPLINGDSQEANNLALTTDPNASTAVWVTGSAANVGGGSRSIVYRGDYSQPSGSQWVYAVWDHAEGNPAEPNTPTIAHSDSRYLGFDAAGNLLLTNDGGIYKLVNPEGAPTQRYWVSLDGTLQDTEFYAVAYDSIDHILVGGAQDNGMGVQPHPGQTVWNTGFMADVTDVAVDNSGPTAILYGISSGFLGINKTTNKDYSEFYRGDFSTTANAVNTPVRLAKAEGDPVGSGLNSEDQATAGSFISPPFVLNTVNPQWLLIGYNGLYLSTDQGDIIADVTPENASGQSIVNGVFSALAFGGASGGVADPNVAVAGTTSGQIFVSVNANTGGIAGGTFNLATTFSGSVVRSIAFDPSDWHTIYIVTTSSDTNASHVWQMVLGNGQVASLTEILGNLTTQASELETVAAVNPAPGVTTLVVGGVGTGNGSVFRSVGPINGSATQWQLLGSGLPNVNVHDLVYNATDDVLVAGTFGRGAWTLANAAQALLPPAPPAPPPPPSPPSPTPPQTLNVPPLLAFFDSLLGAVQTINSNGAETVTASIFGIPLIVSIYDHSGNLVSASLFGITLPNWVWNL